MEGWYQVGVVECKECSANFGYADGAFKEFLCCDSAERTDDFGLYNFDFAV